MGISKEIIEHIGACIESLEERYNVLADSGDSKALLGLERCIELSLRLHGIDSKNSYELSENDITNNNSVINLKDLSTSTLEELAKLSTKKR